MQGVKEQTAGRDATTDPEGADEDELDATPDRPRGAGTAQHEAGASDTDAAYPAGSDGGAGNPHDEGLDARAPGTPLDAGRVDATAGQVLKLSFSPMYSAYDGSHVFKVPLRVERQIGRLTITTTPSAFVDHVGTSFGVMLTTRQAGKATVLVSDEVGNSASASLTVTAAEPLDVERGDTLYHATCSRCHLAEPVANTDAGTSDVEHTPQQTAGFQDSDLVTLFTQGRKIPGAAFRVVNNGGLIPDSIAAQIFERMHAWILDEAACRSLVSYLRSLEPNTLGALDFGGLYYVER